MNLVEEVNFIYFPPGTKTWQLPYLTLPYPIDASGRRHTCALHIMTRNKSFISPPPPPAPPRCEVRRVRLRGGAACMTCVFRGGGVTCTTGGGGTEFTTGDGGTARGLRVGGAACTNTAAAGAACGVRRGGDWCYHYYNYYFTVRLHIL